MRAEGSASGAGRTAAAEWRAGWPVVVTGGLGYAVGTFHLTTLGTMVKPLSATFGWARGEVTGVLMFIGFSALLIGPLVGLLGDRIGVRRIAIGGICLYTTAFAAIGLLTTGDVWTWYASWALMAVVWPAVSPAVWSTGVAGAFLSNRGLALGATLCGAGASNIITPLVAAWAIENMSWRWSYFILGAGGLLIMLPLTVLCFRDARRPDAAMAAAAGPIEGMTLREAARTLRFWKLGVSMLILGLLLAALTVHLQPMLTDAGMSLVDAAKVAAIGGPALILARVAVGFLLDKFRGPGLGAAVISLPIAAMVLLRSFDGSFVTGGVISVCIFLAYGAEIDIVAYMASRYFGMKAFSAIFSSLLGLLTIGGGFGPIVAGRAFDTTGSYDTILLVMIAGTVLSVLLVLSLGKYPTSTAAAKDKEIPT